MVDKTELRTTRSERMTYGIYFIGQNLMYMFIYFFLKQFYVIDMAIPAATVGLIFLISQIWDAVNDPLLGILVDRCHLKGGKFMPWIRVSTFLIPIVVVAIFFMPASMTASAKMTYGLISYAVFSVFYTMCDAPIYAMTTAMTDINHERTRLVSFARIFATIAMILLSIIVPQMYPVLGWPVTIIIICVIALATMLPFSLRGKERFKPEQRKKQMKLSDIWKYLKGNRYLKVFYIGLIIANTLNTSATVANFFAIYNLGNEKYITIVTLLGVVPMFLMALFMPLLNKKWDKYTIFMVCVIFSCVVGFATFFIGYDNATLFFIIVALRGLGSGAVGVMSYVFVGDCVEYGTFATGERAEGITFSIQTFSTKLTGALSGSLALFILGAFGFVEGGGVQSATTLQATWWLMILLPSIGLAIQLLLMFFFYKLRDKDVQMMTKVNMGEISREEAEKNITCQI
jgi:sugar (glycoside-pentoside-hexuronide) transporter